MRFLFVDRILELEKGKYATGIKNVSFSDEYLVNIVPNFPSLPRSLTVESIAQLISWLVIFSKDFSVKPIAVMTDNIKISGDAIPGDQMFIKVAIKSIHENEALCDGTIEVDGKIITELNHGVCAFIPMKELEDVSVVKDRAFSLAGKRSLLEFLDNSEQSLKKTEKFNNDNHFKLNLVDKILDIEIGKHIQGVKNLTMTEDFIVDHFPKRHVMPGTMIIESLIQLSEKLLIETVKAKTGRNIRVLIKESRKIKFRQYVKPGDQMLLDVNLINLQDNTAIIKGKVTVREKLVASTQMELEIVNISK